MTLYDPIAAGLRICDRAEERLRQQPVRTEDAAPACWAIRRDGERIDTSRGVFVREESARAAAARMTNPWHSFEAVPLFLGSSR
jgi:hypothetical protein